MPTARSNVKEHVLEVKLILQEGRGQKPLVRSQNEDEFGEGKQNAQAVTGNSENNGKPEDEEEVLVDDIGSKDAHSLFLFYTGRSPPLDLTGYHLWEEFVLDKGRLIIPNWEFGGPFRTIGYEGTDGKHFVSKVEGHDTDDKIKDLDQHDNEKQPVFLS